MKPAENIRDSYNFFLDVLKFVLKNEDNPQFKDLSLVENYNSLLKDLSSRIDESLAGSGRFTKKLTFEPMDVEMLVETIFGFEHEVYKEYIDSDAKEELIRHFQLILNLTDMALEYLYEDTSFFSGLDLIDAELRNLRELLRPITFLM